MVKETAEGSNKNVRFNPHTMDIVDPLAIKNAGFNDISIDNCNMIMPDVVAFMYPLTITTLLYSFSQAELLTYKTVIQAWRQILEKYYEALGPTTVITPGVPTLWGD